MQERIELLKVLWEAFKIERYVYLALTLISALSLIVVALFLLIDDQDCQSFFALLVPGGTITACIYRILRMWDDSIEFLKVELTS